MYDTQFGSSFRGALLRPGEEGYEQTRRVWNGAIDRRPALIARCVGADDVATAVGEREVGFELNITAAWPAPMGDPAQHRAWVRKHWDALRPDSVGVYANFLSDEGPEGIEAAYGGRLARLTALKDRYDPSNVAAQRQHSTEHQARRAAMSKVLVTGATGNVGPHVVAALRKRGASVRAFVRDPDKARTKLGEGVDTVAGLTGHPPRSFAEWAGEHAAAFAG